MGYHAANVEKKAGSRTFDLFGWIDVVAVTRFAPGVLGIQTTTASHKAHRSTKLGTGEVNRAALLAWLASGNQLELWTWRRGEVTRHAVTVDELGIDRR